MSTIPKNAAGCSSFQWLATLAIVVVPLVVGGTVILSQRMKARSDVNSSSENQQTERRSRHLPPPPPFFDPNMNNLHSVEYAVESDVAIIKITAVPNGDTLIVDAHTGRLIETRPPGPPSPTKAGTQSR
jgi:hypothetical protein